VEVRGRNGIAGPDAELEQRERAAGVVAAEVLG
jgi:hypothetical protein